MRHRSRYEPGKYPTRFRAGASFMPPIRTDRYSEQCKVRDSFGLNPCDKVVSALGPKARATVAHNLSTHRKSHEEPR